MGRTNKTSIITLAFCGACVGILIFFAAGVEANAQEIGPVEATGNVEAEFLLTDLQRAGIDRLFFGSSLDSKPRDISGDLRSLILGTRKSFNSSPSASGTVKFDLNGTHLVMRDTEGNVEAVRGFLQRYKGLVAVNASPEGQAPEQKGARRQNSSIGGLEPSDPEEAAAKGRVLVPDSVSGTIHVVDNPGNIEKTREYLSGSTPRSSGSRRIYRAQHRTARDLGNAMQGLVMYSY